MQIQPYQPQPLVPGNGDRIQVPGGPAVATPGPQPPTLVRVFARETWKRKWLLAVWVVVTLVVAGAAVATFAKPVYRGEGRFSYRPLYGADGPRPIYTPPNIQSAVQILKASDVFEPVRLKHRPDLSPNEFAFRVHIEMARQSEFIDIAYDDPNPAVAAAVTEDLMAAGLQYFNTIRAVSLQGAVAQVSEDLERTKQDLERVKEEYADAFRKKGIASPEVELDNLKSALATIDTRLLEAQQRQAQIPLERTVLEAARDAPQGENEVAVDERMLAAMNALLQQLQQQKLDDQALDEARINLKAAREKELEWRPLAVRGVIPRSEYDDLVTKLRVYESAVQRGEQAKKSRDQLQQRYDELRQQLKSGRPVRTKVIQDLRALDQEAQGLPGKIANLKAEQVRKKKQLAELIEVTREMGPKDEEVRLLRNQLQDYAMQLSTVSGRKLDPHANDLRVHVAPVTPVVPYSTNAPKLALALIGASGLLFIGYIGLFALPAGTFTGPPAAGGLAPPPAAGLLPRALVALVPYTQKPKADQPALNPVAANGMPPASPPPASPEAGAPMDQTPITEPVSPTHVPVEPPVAEPAGNAEPVAVAEPEPVRALAERIVEEGVDRGGIVLFSPTDEELRVAPAIGDLGRFFSDRGDRVLVFDARQAAETPAWVRSDGVDASVAGYLNGLADGTTGCFVPTELQGVEYSRVDLSNHVSGVLETHRFRQLLEQMRERYSVVFVVGPPVNLEADHPLLASMAEGMVLVTETAANPVEVHAYLDTLCQQVPARLYGTLAVPKSAA